MTVPSDLEILFEQGLEASRAEDFVRAVELYSSAIRLNSGLPEAYYKLGNAERSLGHLEAASANYQRAIDLRSNYAHAYCNLGVVQQAMGLAAAALLSYDRAIAIDPADAITHYNRAILKQELSQWEDALQSYDRAVEADPQFADAQYNRACAQLFCGDFESGWRNFEWRWKNVRRIGFSSEREFSQPLWLGDTDIAGKRILLHFEGGLGDTLQFCRYAPLLAARGATVFLEIQPVLCNLLMRLEGVSGLIAAGSALPTFDYHCPLMSLPLAMGTALHTVPSPTGYLRANPALVSDWRALLNDTNRLRVGIVWSGNPKNLIDGSRSIDLAQWLQQLPSEHDYFCLQNHIRETDAVVLDASPRIRRFDENQMDFEGTAALCECMDLVISVDTSIAHLSAALGRPTWILLPWTPDWRWLRDRSDSPWYSSVRLIRQQSRGNWREVLNRVATELGRTGAC